MKNYEEKIKTYSSKPSHKEVMKEVFRPLSPEVQKLISVGGEINGIYIDPEKARGITVIDPTFQAPEWGIRGKSKKLPREKYIPNSPLEKEAEMIGAQTPRAKQYNEAIKKMQEQEQKATLINLQEKEDYENLPDAPSLEEEGLKNPRVKAFLDEEYSQYKNLKSYLENNFKSIDPEFREIIKDKLRVLEGSLVMSGILGKA